jgi:hypothetical protein
VLRKQLWSDATTDFLICAGFALIPLFFCVGLALSSRWIAASIAFLVLVSFVVAGVGLLRAFRWAALLAAGLFFVTGSWLVACYFVVRAKELRV